MNTAGSLCLLRLSALGDVCNCIAPVRAIQRAWPGTRITWIVGRTEHRLVEDLPGVEFVVFDKKAGLKGLAAVRRALAGRRFEVLLHAQVSARSNALAVLVRARRRVGFDRARSREGHGLVINERIPAIAFQHQAEAFMEFVRHLGIDPAGIDRAPPIPAEAEAFAAAHLPEAGRAVLISPCSSHRLRDWPVERYAALADRVIRDFGHPVVLIGGPSARERASGAAIEAAMAERPINLIGKDTLKQSLALIRRSACLVTPDSGPAHFAAALGTPVVGLYAATWSRRSGPLGSLEHCVDRFAQAARRFRGKEPEALRWGTRIEEPGVMELITVEEVVAKVAGALSEPVVL